MAKLSDRFAFDDDDLSDRGYHKLDELVSDTLEELRFIGPLYKDPIIIGLLVPPATALAEIQLQLEMPTLTESAFKKILSKNEIYLPSEADKLFQKHRREKKQGSLSRLEKGTMISQLKKLADQLEISHSKIQYCADRDRMCIVGGDGRIYYDDFGKVTAECNGSSSSRKWTATQEKLSFMSFDADFGNNGGRFKLARDFAPQEAEILRDRLGIPKKRSRVLDSRGV